MRQRDHLRLVLCLGLSLASLAVLRAPVAAQTQPAAAPSPEARKEASVHFSRGVDLFEEGAFRAALVEFERAYTTAPDYRLLYNIGHAHNELHDYLRATQSYERYLADGGSAVSAERRREVEGMLTQLASRVARLSIHTNIASAEVFVDDQQVGVAPLASTIPVNVGRHRVFARTASGFSGEKLVDVAGGDLAEVNLELTSAVPQSSNAQPLASSAGRSDEPRGFSALQKAAIASWVLVAPLAAGAIATGVVASQKADERDDLLDQRPVDGALKNKAGELRDSVKSLALASDCLTAASVLVAATGVVLWFTGGRAKSDQKANAKPRALALDVGFGNARLVGQF